MVKATIRAKYPDWVTVYSDIEAKAREIQHELEVRRNDLRELLIAVLYVRTIGNVTSAILVVEQGYDVQGRILLRAAMESLFSLVAIEKDPEQAKKFTVANELERKRMFNKSRAWSGPDLKAKAEQHATDEKRLEIEETIKATNARIMSTEYMAKAAGLHDWYLTAYSIFSGSVHSNVRDLQRHLELSEEHEIQAIRNEPVIEELDRLYLTAANILLKALESLESVFGVNSESFRFGVNQRLGQLEKNLER